MKGSKEDIQKGEWRSHEEPIQVVSGAMGKEKVHYEAPPSAKITGEMTNFIIWFNETVPGGKKEINNPILRSAMAHLYFESIHLH